MLSKEEFKIIFDKNFDAVRDFAFYLCGDSDMASDIAQDVFMKIWEKQDNLGKRNLKPLLCRMAKNLYLDNYRRKKLHVDFVERMKLIDDTEFSPEEIMISKETANIYTRTLEQLPEMQRTVFVMSRENGMKNAEIAEIFKISIKTVEKYINLTGKILKIKLLQNK